MIATTDTPTAADATAAGLMYREAEPTAPWEHNAPATRPIWRAYWKRLDEWKARVAAAWAAVPVQEITRLQVEQLVVKPYGATGTIEIGADDHISGVPHGEPAFMVKDAKGRLRLKIHYRPDGDGTEIALLGPCGAGDDHPYYRLTIGVFGGNGHISVQDAAGTDIFHVETEGCVPLSDLGLAPADADTPERAAAKAKSRVIRAELNKQSAAALRQAHAYNRAYNRSNFRF